MRFQWLYHSTSANLDGSDDGYIRALSQDKDEVLVTVEGDSGKRYTVRFNGVSAVESHSPVDMMLYGLSEEDTNVGLLRRYDFINWYGDEPEKEAKSYLRIVASGFIVTECDWQNANTAV